MIFSATFYGNTNQCMTIAGLQDCWLPEGIVLSIYNVVFVPFGKLSLLRLAGHSARLEAGKRQDAALAE
jgi:hypothetical protein